MALPRANDDDQDKRTPGRRVWIASVLALLLPALIAYSFRLVPQDTFDLEVIAFAIAILVCSLLGGIASGLLCTALVALITNYHFVPPFHSFSITAGPEYTHWLSLLAAGVALSVLTVVLRDSIRRHTAEDAREQSELRFRQMADTVEEVFWLSTPDASGILYVSPGFETIWGRKCEELYRQPTLWTEAIHPHDIALVRKSLEELARGKEYDIDFRITRPDGSERWINDRGYVRRDAEGKAILTSGIATDITTRREMEEALRTSERRLSSIVASAMDGIVSIDDDQRITLVNFAAEQMFGRSATRMLGRPLTELMPERYRAAHPAHVRNFGVSGETQRGMGRLGVVYGLRADGTEFPVEASISQVEYEGRKRYTAIFRDITQRIENERRIARLTRIYAVLSGINSAIVRIHQRQKLFDEACRILVEVGKFPTAWIGLLDADSRKVTPVAWRGPEGDRDLVFRVEFSSLEDTPDGSSTVGRAIRERQAAVNSNLGLQTGTRPVIKQLVERGYRSIIALPLLTEKECRGVLALHSRDADVFDQQEIGLLTELADDISFALDYIAKEEEIMHLAFHDPLTGLANRTALHQRLTQVTRDANTQHPFALLLMNLNNFRDINDTLGHKNGDALLNAIAARISNSLWESDVVACLGGDEFAILLPHLATRSDIELVVHKITETLQRPISVEGLPINVEASMGIALYPDHGTTADLLWQHADIALREGKASHRPYLLYLPEINHYDPGKLALLGGLRTAIDLNQLVLHYQPTIDLQNERAAGVEALLRWQHPDRGLIFPDQFIPLVERTGLIEPLTNWVLRSALRQAQAWHQSGFTLELSVNLSARNLLNDNLAAEILDLVCGARFPLERLTLEVTESAIMTAPERAEAVLKELNDAGINISMDDFGIGQSSLSYLKDLPITKMKIDKSFVIDHRQPRNAAIVRSAVELAHNLGLGVTAEGVEDRATYLALRDLGCERAQGYYFSKPLPADRLTDWLRTSPWKCKD